MRERLGAFARGRTVRPAGEFGERFDHLMSGGVGRRVGRVVSKRFISFGFVAAFHVGRTFVAVCDSQRYGGPVFALCINGASLCGLLRQR